MPESTEELPVIVSDPIIKARRKYAQHNIVSRSPTCLSLTSGKIARFLISCAQQGWKENPGQIYFTIKLSRLTKFLGEKPVDFIPHIKNLIHWVVDWNLIPQFHKPQENFHVDQSPFLMRYAINTDSHGDQLLTYGFPPHLRPLLIKPMSYFRTFELSTIRKIQSKYTLQLYNYLASCLPKDKNEIRTEFITEQQLRALLGCEHTHPELRVFNQDVVKPALDGLEAMTEISAGYILERPKGIRRYQFLVWRKRNWEREHWLELEKTIRLRQDPEKGAAFLDSFIPHNHEVHEKEKEFFNTLKYQVEEQKRKENPEALPWQEWNEWFFAQPCRLTTYKGHAYFICNRSTQMVHIYGNYKTLIYSLAKSLGIPSVFFEINDIRGRKKPAKRALRKHHPAENCIILP